MDGFSIKKTNRADASESGIVAVSGDMTIQNAAELRNCLLEAFSDGEGVCLEMDQVTGVDLACLQLLCAAHGMSMTEKKRFSVRGMDSEAIKSVVRDAGFPRHTGCVRDIGKSCIWAGGVKQWER